jgi:hypothetical protein
VDRWAANLVDAATPAVYPFVYPTTTPVSQPATVVSVPNPITTVKPFVVRAWATWPYPAWTDNTNHSFYSVGAYSPTNSVWFVIYNSILYNEIRDAATNIYDVYGTSSIVAGTEYAGSIVYMNAKPSKLFWDSTQKTSVSGTGTGLLTSAPTPIYIGSSGAAGAYPINGYVRRIIQCTGTNYSMCK